MRASRRPRATGAAPAPSRIERATDSKGRRMVITIQQVKRFQNELPGIAAVHFERWRSEAALIGPPAAATAAGLGVQVCRADMFEPTGRVRRGSEAVFDEVAEALDRTSGPERDRLVGHIFGHDVGSHVLDIVYAMERERHCEANPDGHDLLARTVNRIRDGIASPEDEERLRVEAIADIGDDEILELEIMPRRRSRGRPLARRWHLVTARRWHPCASGILNIMAGERHLSVRCNGADSRWHHLRYSRVAFWLNAPSTHAHASSRLREALENVAVYIDPLD